jgi:hypothetical protein
MLYQKNHAMSLVSNYKGTELQDIPEKEDIRDQANRSSQNRATPVIERAVYDQAEKKRLIMTSFWVSLGLVALLVLGLKLKIINF